MKVEFERTLIISSVYELIGKLKNLNLVDNYIDTFCIDRDRPISMQISGNWEKSLDYIADSMEEPTVYFTTRTHSGSYVEFFKMDKKSIFDIASIRPDHVPKTVRRYSVQFDVDPDYNLIDEFDEEVRLLVDNWKRNNLHIKGHSMRRLF